MSVRPCMYVKTVSQKQKNICYVHHVKYTKLYRSCVYDNLKSYLNKHNMHEHVTLRLLFTI